LAPWGWLIYYNHHSTANHSGECVGTSVYLHLEIVPCEECSRICKQLRLQAIHYLHNLLCCNGYIISKILFHTHLLAQKERDCMHGLHNTASTIRLKSYLVWSSLVVRSAYMFKLIKWIRRYAHLYKTFYHPCQEMCDKNLEYVNIKYPPFM